MTTLKERARWRIAYLLNRLPRQCWTDLVTWALGWRDHERRNPVPWFPASDVCRRDADECGRCYCGKLQRKEQP